MMTATKPTAFTHVFIGTFRPPLGTVMEMPINNCQCCGVEYCACGSLFPMRRVECWRQGCYDEPVYITIEEALKRKIDADDASG